MKPVHVEETTQFWLGAEDGVGDGDGDPLSMSHLLPEKSQEAHTPEDGPAAVPAKQPPVASHHPQPDNAAHVPQLHQHTA